jgi:hypothetical protein
MAIAKKGRLVTATGQKLNKSLCPGEANKSKGREYY